MAGLQDAAKWYTCIFVLTLWIDQAQALGCAGVDPNLVVNICEGQEKTAPRLFLETASLPDDGYNCTCFLSTSADKLSISLSVAPNYDGCQSSLEFMTTSPITFECLLSGINADVSSKKQFDVNFRRTTLTANRNYCVDIKAQPSAGGSITTLTLNCPSSKPTTSTSTSSSTSTSTSSTTSTTSTTSTASTTTTTTPTATFEPPATSEADTTSQGQVAGEITTEGQTTVTEETTSQTTTYINTGFPSSVRQTAIIIVCVIVGAGLLVGIIIAIVVIMGKRNESKQNKNKHRFSAPGNSNLELAAENGTANGHSSTDKNKNTNQLHRTSPSSALKSQPSHTVYDNNGYVSTESHKDTLVISEKL